MALAELRQEIPRTILPVADTVASVASHGLTYKTSTNTRLNLLRIGMSVERFHAKQGFYPESLEVIAPILGTEIPTDPFTGKPYHYLRSDDSFLLYSVGEDLENDGGVHDYRGGDLVWRGE